MGFLVDVSGAQLALIQSLCCSTGNHPLVVPIKHVGCKAVFCTSCAVNSQCPKCKKHMQPPDDVSRDINPILVDMSQLLAGSCSDCHQQMEYREFLRLHPAQCPEAQTPCSHPGCPVMVKRSRHADHVAICDRRVLPCRGAAFKCTFTAEARELEKHEASCGIAQMSKQIEILTLREKQHQEEIKTLKSQLQGILSPPHSAQAAVSRAPAAPAISRKRKLEPKEGVEKTEDADEERKVKKRKPILSQDGYMAFHFDEQWWINIPSRNSRLKGILQPWNRTPNNNAFGLRRVPSTKGGPPVNIYSEELLRGLAVKRGAFAQKYFRSWPSTSGIVDTELQTILFVIEKAKAKQRVLSR